MAQNFLHGLDIHAVLQHQRGRRVPQLVTGISFTVQPRARQMLLYQGVDRGPADALVLAGEEQCVPVLAADRSSHRHVLGQRVLAGAVEIHYPHLVALAQHPQRIVLDVIDIQPSQLRNT